ncbi:MAG: branched-chain amino acid ABC transporter permease [Desulfomonilaceae bacterium]
MVTDYTSAVFWPSIEILELERGKTVITNILQAIFNGILTGGVYAVVSVGLSLVFGIVDVVNFAQPEFLMMGMFVAYFLSVATGLDPTLASPLVFLVVFCFGALVQKYLVQRVLDAPLVVQVFLTVAIGMVMVSVAQLLFGADFRSAPTSYTTMAVHLGPFQFNVPQILAFFGAAILASLLWVFMEWTDLGRSIRATAQNRTAAVLVGINPYRMYILAFALGTGLAGAAGAMILPYSYVFPTIGHDWGLIMFTVVVLGGLGSVPGAMIAGIIIGVIQSLTSVFFPTQLQNLFVFVVFILVLAYRPAGLLGDKSS